MAGEQTSFKHWKDRVLYWEGNWGVLKQLFGPELYAVHKDCREGESGCATGKATKCWQCDETVPEGIQGLIAMYNWGLESG